MKSDRSLGGKQAFDCSLVCMKVRRRIRGGLIISALILGLAQSSVAQCDLQIVSAGPCLADGTPGTPAVGDDYGLRVVVNVVGTPTGPFRIQWTMANTTNSFDNITVGPGDGYWWYLVLPVYLDDKIPWSVTLDPDRVSGDTNLANNTASGTFTPTPPATAAELFDTRVVSGSETSILDYQPGERQH